MRTIWPRQLFVACVTLLLTPAATSADTRYEEKIEYYDLGRDITSTGAIWQAIRHRGPGRKVGGNRKNSSVVGTARSQIKRNYRFAKGRNGLCSLTELNIDLKVTITLPKWRWQHDKPRKLKDYFQCVLNTVTKHENRHAAIWRETVEEMTDTVNRRMTNVACDTFKARMSKTIDDAYQHGVRRQHAFDRADYQRRRYQKCLQPGADTSWRIAQRDSRRAVLRRSADRPRSKLETRKPTRARQVQGGSRKIQWRQNGGGSVRGERMLDGSVLAGAGLMILLIGGGWFFFVTGRRSGFAVADTEDRSDWMERAFENVQVEADTMKRTVNMAGQPSRQAASCNRKAGAAPVFGRRSGPQPQS